MEHSNVLSHQHTDFMPSGYKHKVCCVYWRLLDYRVSVLPCFWGTHYVFFFSSLLDKELAVFLSLNRHRNKWHYCWLVPSGPCCPPWSSPSMNWIWSRKTVTIAQAPQTLLACFPRCRIQDGGWLREVVSWFIRDSVSGSLHGRIIHCKGKKNGVPTGVIASLFL